MSASHILIQSYADVTVVTLTDSAIIHAPAIEELAKELYPLVDVQNKQKIVLDFTNVRLFSSHMVGVLVTLNKKIKEIKGTLCLCAVRKEVMKIFELTNLTKQFAFHQDDAAALAAHGIRVK